MIQIIQFKVAAIWLNLGAKHLYYLANYSGL